MGAGWKDASGCVYSRGKCKCGRGEVIIYISDHEESDYPPFTRGGTYSGVTTCPRKCVDLEKMSQYELERYNRYL